MSLLLRSKPLLCCLRLAMPFRRIAALRPCLAYRCFAKLIRSEASRFFAFASHGYTLPSLLMTLLSAAPLCRISALSFLSRALSALPSRRRSVRSFALALLFLSLPSPSSQCYAFACLCRSSPLQIVAYLGLALPLLYRSVLRYAIALPFPASPTLLCHCFTIRCFAMPLPC